jgi:hypothetical protein
MPSTAARDGIWKKGLRPRSKLLKHSSSTIEEGYPWDAIIRTSSAAHSSWLNQLL